MAPDEEVALAPIADGRDHPLDPRWVPLERLVGWIVTACVAAGSLVACITLWLTGALPWLGWRLLLGSWVVLNALLAWLLQIWPGLEYRYTSYRVDDQGIEIRRGVYWRTVTNVPRSRVQHTDVSQGPLQRSHGLGTLSIYTAGTDHAQVDLSGLSHSCALRIREHLLPRHERPESDAV